MKKVILALLPFVLLAAALPVFAQPRPGWRGGFHEHDIVVWRGGHWFHGWHGPRLGWWWIVGGAWYWYPAPVYPYPDVYTPYVPECASGWKTVPATPPPRAATPTPPPPPYGSP